MRFSMGTERWHALPFSLKLGRTTWSVATDGHVLLAVKTAGAKASKEYHEDLEEMLTQPAADPTELDLTRIKEWAGTPPLALIPSGEVLVEYQGVLLGTLIDRRKLAYLFAKVTIPVVRVWVYRAGVLGFEPPDRQWRAFLAGCDAKPDGSETVFSAQMTPFELAELADGA